MRRAILCRLDVEPFGNFVRHGFREGKTAYSFEGEKLVDIVDRDEARLPRSERRHLAPEEGGNPIDAGIDAVQIFSFQALPGELNRIERASS